MCRGQLEKGSILKGLKCFIYFHSLSKFRITVMVTVEMLVMVVMVVVVMEVMLQALVMRYLKTTFFPLFVITNRPKVSFKIVQ